MKEYRPEDYIQYRIQRAWETIAEVQVHIDNKFWNTAINFYISQSQIIHLPKHPQSLARIKYTI